MMPEKDLQYFHYTEAEDIERRFTVCMDVPFKVFFNKLFTMFGNKKFGTNIGIATVHPTDPYVKAVGREVARQKMKSVALVITNIEFKEHETLLHIQDEWDTMWLTLSLNKDRDRARLINFDTAGSDQ